MNKIEQMHLDAIDFNTIVHHDVPNDVDSIKAASKSAEITEQIAIEFAHYYFKETFNETLYSEFRTTEQIFQEFLKTNQ